MEFIYVRIIKMQIDLSQLIKQRIEEFEKNPELSLKVKGTEYQKKWAEGVKYFQDRINQDRKKEKKPEVNFMQVRMKLLALKEIDDLRSFYKTCLDYSYTRDKKTGKRKTFSQCFWGALKIK